MAMPRWRGSSGKVACIDLWQSLLQQLSNPNREILWVKVPSHVDVPSNEEADRLSKVGRMSHPLFPTKATPALQIISASATPKVKKAKHEPSPDAPHTPLLPKTLDFSFFAILSPDPSCVPPDSTHAPWDELGMLPMRLPFALAALGTFGIGLFDQKKKKNWACCPCLSHHGTTSIVIVAALQTARVNCIMLGPMGLRKPQRLGLWPPPSITPGLQHELHCTVPAIDSNPILSQHTTHTK